MERISYVPSAFTNNLFTLTKYSYSTYKITVLKTFQISVLFAEIYNIFLIKTFRRVIFLPWGLEDPALNTLTNLPQI